MTTRTLAWALWALGAVAFLGGIAAGVADHTFGWADLSQGAAFAAIGVVGLVVALHRRRNAIGWIYLAVWDGFGLVFGAAGGYASWAARARPPAPGATFATWLTGWAWVPIFTLLLTYPFLLFPDGHLLSRRWRPVAWAIGLAGMLWSIAVAFEGADYTDALGRRAPNPYTPAGIVGVFDIAREVMAVVVLGLVAATVASLVVRYRRARGDEREQIRWLMLAAGITFAWLLLPLNHGSGGIADFIQGFVLALIPLAIGVGVLKYRLYDVDTVIRRTVVVGLLGAFITVVYIGVVVGLGALVAHTLVLQIAATAIVAIAFQPIRERANRLASRLVYGRRATPYEVLARFGERVAGTYASDDVLPRVARVIAEGTSAARSEVWLHLGDELRLTASWPVGEHRDPVPIRDGELPPIDADRLAPVRHRGELLGAIAVAKPASDPLSPGEVELVDHLAEQAGLILANARLTADLEARLEQIRAQAAELRASRQRIVSAQDDERRTLERNIHDGAQQRLVALAVKLRLARSVLAADPDRGRAMLVEIGGEIDSALDTLRSLARGIYPPLLEEQGVAAALAAQYVHTDLPVRMEAGSLGRYPIEIEAAVYFCALEALQNTVKYAGASRIAIHLGEVDGALTFAVSDDGIGFDPSAPGSGTGLQGMRDRLAVFGGDVRVESSPGEGTTVRGRVPVGTRAPA